MKYRPGKSYSDADTLSWLLLYIEDNMSRCSEKSSLKVVQATICSAQSQSLADFPWYTALTDSIRALDDYHIIPPDQHIDFKQAQELDPVISGVVHFLQSGKRPSVRERRGESRELHRLLFESNKLILGSDIVLYRQTGTNEQVALPRKLRRIILKGLHGDMGHMGAERVFHLAKARFHWPHMKIDVTSFVTKVCKCMKQKPPVVKQREPLNPIVTLAPFQMVSLNFLHVEATAGGSQYILVVMVHFTRYAQAYTTKDKSAKTAAERVYNDFLLRFGVPETIHHDQGGEFENNLF